MATVGIKGLQLQGSAHVTNDLINAVIQCEVLYRYINYHYYIDWH